MPATITVNFEHNHLSLNAEALSFRKTDLVVQHQFEEYFNECMSAAAASEFHSNQLDMNPNLDCPAAVARADAAVNPKRSTVSYWYGKWREANLGKRHGQGMWDMLENKVAAYTASGARISVEREPFTVALLTPIMQRAHQMLSAGDVAFVDSTASCDAENHVITFVLVTSPYGAVPAGVVITTGQSLQNYTAGFAALKNLLPDPSFGGEGYPSVFVTDDSAAERGGLQSVWPDAVQVFCHFHVMQAVWRWLWNAAHGISKDDRKELMQGFRKVLYAVDRVDAGTLYQELLQLAEDYPNFMEYVEGLWERREAWCMAWRNIPALRGHHTNNYAEVTVRLFKDNILSRCKAYNAIAIIDFIVSVMERFYSNRLQRFANSRVTMHSLLLEKLLARCAYIQSKDDIRVVPSQEGNSYLVPSEEDWQLLYEMDAVVGVCTCPSGMAGRCCKHQIAVFKWYGESLPNVPSVTDEARYTAAYLALGKNVPSAQFYGKMMSCDGGVPLLVSTQSVEVCDLSTQLHSNQSPVDASVDESAASCTVVEQWRLLSGKIEALLEQHKSPYSEDDVRSGLQKVSQRVGNINTGAQLTSFFHSFGHLVARLYRSGSMIRTQPTSAARRKPCITRGAKRQPSGRPAVGQAAAAKRPRKLGYNIEHNVAHAKSHGKGH